MSSHPPVETIESHGCTVVLRSIEGAGSKEFFLHCRPPPDKTDAEAQAATIYRAIHEALRARGASLAVVMSETVFLRNLPANIDAVRAARELVFADPGLKANAAAITEIEQPPLDQQACLEILVHAVLPGESSIDPAPLAVAAACDCKECAQAHGLRIQASSEVRVLAGGLCGAGDTAYEQTCGMFELAERLLKQAGLEFSDVVRTWIYLREMDRDYADFNRARREFFTARGIQPVPASTAIGGGPVADRHDLCLGIYAVKGDRPIERTVMTSPTLNEAPEYGADFVRGMQVVEANKVALIVSGTASVDETGATAHVGDFAAQVDRMLANISALLAGQGATFADVAVAITYVKYPADALHLRHQFQQAGFEGFPNVFVEADVCRPELLCETELVAVVPKM